jgi:hypothetical protein
MPVTGDNGLPDLLFHAGFAPLRAMLAFAFIVKLME